MRFGLGLGWVICIWLLLLWGAFMFFLLIWGLFYPLCFSDLFRSPFPRVCYYSERESSFWAQLRCPQLDAHKGWKNILVLQCFVFVPLALVSSVLALHEEKKGDCIEENSIFMSKVVMPFHLNIILSPCYWLQVNINGKCSYVAGSCHVWFYHGAWGQVTLRKELDWHAIWLIIMTNPQSCPTNKSDGSRLTSVDMDLNLKNIVYTIDVFPQFK